MTTTTKKEKGAVGKFVSDVLSTDKKIGELNGKWAVMLKMVVLTGTVVFPLILAWSIWVTSNIFSSEHHVMDTGDFRDRIQDVEKALVVTPERIQRNSEALEKLQTEVKEVSNANAVDHQGIMVQLSKIQTQLESIEKNR